MIVLSIITTILTILFFPTVAAHGETDPKDLSPAETTPELIATYAQEVWISALEWCESRGNPAAINQKDLDGTPSYYSFQFKPATFRWLGERYGVIPKGLSGAQIMEEIKDTEKQKDIIRGMILDPDPPFSWSGQFPDCIRSLGRPPSY